MWSGMPAGRLIASRMAGIASLPISAASKGSGGIEPSPASISGWSDQRVRIFAFQAVS